jgi:DNA-binding MarR family transcriptional regulator
MPESNHDRRSTEHEADREPLVQYEDLEQATGFTQVNNAVLRCYPELSDGEKMTYAVLKSFAYVGPETFVGQETLARARDSTVSTVSRHLTRLIDVGLVGVRRRGQGKTNIWIIKRIPREKLEEYIHDWRPNVELRQNPQTKTCGNPQVKSGQDSQAQTEHNCATEEEQSEEEELNKKEGDAGQDAASPSPDKETTRRGSSGDERTYTSEQGIVENSEAVENELSTSVENAGIIAQRAAERFGVGDERSSIEGYLRQYDPAVAAGALDRATARVDEGQPIRNPIAYFYALVKVMQAEEDASRADEAQRRAVAESWARSLLREWPEEDVRAILLDTYHSEDFVEEILSGMSSHDD